MQNVQTGAAVSTEVAEDLVCQSTAEDLVCQSTAEEDDPVAPSTVSLANVQPEGKFYHSYTQRPAAISEHLYILLHCICLSIIYIYLLACIYSFCVGSISPVTPFKHLSPTSFSVGANLSLSPNTTISYDHLELPSTLTAWKMQIEGTSVTIYRVLTQGIPEGYPTIYITHVLAFAGHQWYFWVHNKPLLMTSGAGLLPPAAPLLEFPPDCTTASVARLLHSIEKLRVCQGAGIPPVDASKVPHAFVDIVPTPIMEADVRMQTFRDDQCTLLVPTSMLRCQDCTRLKERQRQKALRESQQGETSGSSCFTANAYLSTPKKLQKLAILAVNQKDSRRKINTLTARIEAMCQKDGILVDSELHQDLVAIVGESQQTLPDGSFRKLFWEQQVKALQNKDPRQRRWHPLIIKWCLNLKMMSSSAYHSMRTSGMLVLPSERTLRDYANAIKGGEGFSIDVIRQLFDEARNGQNEIPYHRR